MTRRPDAINALLDELRTLSPDEARDMDAELDAEMDAVLDAAGRPPAAGAPERTSEDDGGVA